MIWNLTNVAIIHWNCSKLHDSFKSSPLVQAEDISSLIWEIKKYWKSHQSSETELLNWSQWTRLSCTLQIRKRLQSPSMHWYCQVIQATASNVQYLPSYMSIHCIYCEDKHKQSWEIESSLLLCKKKWKHEIFTFAYLKIAIKMNVEPKYGITVRVFFSSSWSSVLEAKRDIEMCLK